MTEIFNITNRALIHVTKTDIYKAQTILSIVEILLLATITILLMIACKITIMIACKITNNHHTRITKKGSNAWKTK